MKFIFSRSVSLFIISFFCIIAFIIKINQLAFVEAGQDQTSYIFWLHSILNSKNFLPFLQEDLNFSYSLMLDEGSFLNSFLKPIYNSPTNIFTVISLLWFGLGSLILDASVENQIILSILANSLCIYLLSSYLFYFVKDKKYNNQILLISILTFYFLSSSSFIHGFSTYGSHNVGILFLILATIYLEKYIKKIESNQVNVKTKLKLIFFQSLAFYAMYTNIFLIPTAFIISIFFLNININKKIYEIFSYLFLTTIIIIPAIILLIVRFQTFEVSSDQSFIYWGKFVFELNNNTELNYLTILYGNFMRWYSYNTLIFGKFTFILSFLGLFLALKKFKFYFIFSIPVSHLIISTLMAGFTYANDRTSAYLIPFIAFGFGFLVYYSIEYFFKIKSKKKLIIPYILLLVTSLSFISKDLIRNYQQILKPELIYASWSRAYSKDSVDYWKKILKNIEKKIPKESVVITSNNSQRIILSSHDHLDKSFNYFGSIDSFEYKPSKMKKLIYTNRLENLLNQNNNIFIVIFKKIKSELQNQKEMNAIKIENKNLNDFLCSLKNELCAKKLLLYNIIDLNPKLTSLDLANKILIYRLE